MADIKLIGVCGQGGAGKDTFYELVLKPRGFLRWPMTLHYKVWLAARGYDWEDIFYTKPKDMRQILQEEVTLLVCPRIDSTDLDVLFCKTNFTVRTSGLAAHRMTSPAWKRRVGGIVRPSASAVLRLMINSYLVGCSTGRSAGLAPFRIFST